MPESIKHIVVDTVIALRDVAPKQVEGNDIPLDMWERWIRRNQLPHAARSLLVQNILLYMAQKPTPDGEATGVYSWEFEDINSSRLIVTLLLNDKEFLRF